MKRLAGKRLYITGGSSGIGKATAIEAVRAGAHVVISARGEGRLNEVLEELKKHAGEGQIVDAVRVDIADRAQVEETASVILEKLGGLDILINNAGVAHVERIEEASPDVYVRMMEINYLGTVWTTLAFVPHFQKQRSGTIAAVSSTLGLMGLVGYSAYAGSKYAITGFYDCLRQDLLKDGVQVSVMFPADVDTPQLAEENKIKPPETKALASTASLAQPEVVARAFLKGLLGGKYHIMPGFENRSILWAHHKVPWLVRWVIDRDLKKFWKKHPVGPAAGNGASEATP